MSVLGDEIKVGDWVIQTLNCCSTVEGEKYKVRKEGIHLAIGKIGGCCTCKGQWKKIEGGNEMKKVWEVIVIDKAKEEIVVREIVIDGDEKSACSKVSITHAAKLKELKFEDLYYIARELGSYECKKEEEEDD